VLSDHERRFLLTRRVGHLATADSQAIPHVVPVCFTIWQGTLYITIDWVMLRGRAEILRAGTEHDRAQELLRSRYRQLAAMQIAERPVIAVRLERVTSWGNLSVGADEADHDGQA
jgi:nitroimidazol reductase NimA-like FMN-containing flavoprotein (pyridoxamine 5'-phosphate oxidase superfamily)